MSKAPQDFGLFGSMNPNTEHQRWSRWIFGVEAGRKLPRVKDCIDNARRFFTTGFQSSVGRVKVNRVGTRYTFTVEIEGPPVHDGEYALSVRKVFVDKFMAPGFGAGARLVAFDRVLLAGSAENGKPPDQMLVMPNAPSTAKLFTP